MLRRRRSLSLGNLPLLVSGSGEPAVSGRSVRAPVSVSIAARELNAPAVQGYLDRRVGHGEWRNVWCVLKDQTIYIYTSPIDEDTLDLLPLTDWQLVAPQPDTQPYGQSSTPSDTQSDSQSNEESTSQLAVELVHQDVESEYYVPESLDQLQTWLTELRKAGCHDFRDDQSEASSADSWLQQDLARRKKQELLEELLAQKEELLARLGLQQDGSQVEDAEELIESLDSDSDTEERELREMILLRKRRMSMQLKIDNMQRILHEQKKQKKKFRLSLGAKSKPSPTAPQASAEGYAEHVRQLTSKLDNVNKDIESKKQTLQELDIGKTLDLNQNMQILERSEKKKPSSSIAKRFSSNFLSTNKVGKKKNNNQSLLKTSLEENSILRHSWSPDDFAESCKQQSQMHKSDSEKDLAVLPSSAIGKGHQNGSNLPSARLNISKQNDRYSPLVVVSEHGEINDKLQNSSGSEDLGVEKRINSNEKKLEVKAETLARIAAFEEFLQEKLHNV